MRPFDHKSKMNQKGGIQMVNFLNRLFKKQTTVTPIPEAQPSFTQTEIFSPLTGRVIPLKDISDPVFSQEMMGKGVAIEPTDGKVVSPITGTVVMVFDTHHAIGLKSEEGVEVLIHVGMDTVELKGKGFTPHVQNGDRVSVGDLLVEADLAFIQEAGYSIVTPVVITNSADYRTIESTSVERVNPQDHLLTITK